MNEMQRQQYLEAIGIDSYMPRWILPVAPRPVACAPVTARPVESIAANTAPLANPAAVVSRVTPAAGLAQVTAAVADVTAQVSVAPRVAAATPAVPPVAVTETLAALAEPAVTAVKPTAETVINSLGVAAETDPQFALSMWRASDDLLVIDSRQAQLALPTEPLLANILLALGLRQPLPRAEVLHWPMYDHPLAPKGEAAAKETLMALLEARLEQQPVSYLLLMGAEACHYILPDELLPADSPQPPASCQALLGKALRLDALKATAIVVPSLSDMLQQPDLKATTWRAIQPLRQI